MFVLNFRGVEGNSLLQILDAFQGDVEFLAAFGEGDVGDGVVAVFVAGQILQSLAFLGIAAAARRLSFMAPS